MLSPKNQKSQITRIIVGISIMILIALAHIYRLGTFLEGNFKTFYYSYFSDIIIPFGMYYLLCINEISIKFLKPWRTKAISLFVITASVEVMQGLGFYVLGSTFDYFDLLAYAFGVFLAVSVDKFLFKKYIPHWNYDK